MYSSILLLLGYAVDPTVAAEDKYLGNTVAAEEEKGKTVFEPTKARLLDKRKRKKNDQPEDIDGFLGPWGGYKDEQRVMKPNEVRFWFLNLYKF